MLSKITSTKIRVIILLIRNFGMIVPRNKNPTDQIYELALYVYRFKNDDFVINDVKTNKTTTICKTVIISEMFLLEK